VFICPRTSWSGYPIKLLNAMSASLPVVACESSAHPVQDGKTGIIVPDDDVEAMTDAVLSLLDDQYRRRKFGSAGRRRSSDLYARRGMIQILINKVLP
jgi:glycosyltransferase involved in cell wall biosynthesis